MGLNIIKHTFQFLWNELKWDYFMPVITGSDRIGHFLWHIYEDNEDRLHERILDYFHEIDKCEEDHITVKEMELKDELSKEKNDRMISAIERLEKCAEKQEKS